MALVTTLGQKSDDWLRHELDPQLYRKEITIPSGTGDLETGTVMAKLTANGKHVPHVNGAADGSETPVGILLDGRDASGADDVKGVIVSGEAEITSLGLKWDASVDDQAKKDAALLVLEGLGFQDRKLV